MGGRNSSNQSSSSQNVNNSQGVNSGVGMNYGVNQSGNFGTNQSNNFGFNQGSSSGGSASSSASQDKVWDQQSPFLQDVFAQAQDAFTQGMESIDGLTPEAQAQMTQAMNNSMNAFMQQQGGGMSGQVFNNIAPNGFTDQLQQQVLNDAGDIKAQNLASLDARAAASGMSGSSGYRDQVSNMMDNVDQNAANTMANIGNQAYNDNIRNQLAAAGQADQVMNSAVNNVGAVQQGIMGQYQPGMMGQQAAQLYAGTIGGPTVLNSASSQSSSSNKSNNFGMNMGNSFGQNMGFANGMNAGMNMSGGVNAGSGFGSSTGQGSSSGWNIAPPTFSFVG